MKKNGDKLLIYLLTGQIIVTTLISQMASAQNKQSAGAILGGIIGGLITNSSSSAENRDFNTLIGILGGAFIGSAIGRDMDQRDQAALAEAKKRSLEENTEIEWDGEDSGSSTGAHGSIRVTQTGFHRRTHEMCRRYESRVNTHRGSEVFRGVSCLSRSGEWREVPEADVIFDSHSPTQTDLPSHRGGVISTPSTRRSVENQRARNTGIVASVSNQTSEVEITRISRRSGGEYFAIDFDRPVQIDQIQIQVLDGQVVIHKVAFATERGFQFLAQNISNTGRVFAGRILMSENLRKAGAVTGIEIQAESMGSLADIRVRVVGSSQAPQLYLGQGPLR